MGWIVLIIIAAVALSGGAGASPGVNKGLRVSEDCSTVEEVDVAEYFKHALAVMRARDWTTPIQSPQEARDRILATFYEAFPRCEGTVPVTWGGRSLESIVEDLRKMVQPGIEASGAASSAAEAIARGAPFVYESVAATFNPGAPTPTPNDPLNPNLPPAPQGAAQQAIATGPGGTAAQCGIHGDTGIGESPSPPESACYQVAQGPEINPCDYPAPPGYYIWFTEFQDAAGFQTHVYHCPVYQGPVGVTRQAGHNRYRADTIED